MTHVNLSALSKPELRQLLDATRRRGDAALSYQILQEMAVRRDGEGKRARSPARRSAEPRFITVDLGDPLDRKDEPPPLPPLYGPAVGLKREPPPVVEEASDPPAAPAPEPGAEAWDLRLPERGAADARPKRRLRAGPAWCSWPGPSWELAPAGGWA